MLPQANRWGDPPGSQMGCSPRLTVRVLPQAHRCNAPPGSQIHGAPPGSQTGNTHRTRTHQQPCLRAWVLEGSLGALDPEREKREYRLDLAMAGR